MVFLPSKYESGFTLSIRKTSWIILPVKSKRTCMVAANSPQGDICHLLDIGKGEFLI
jgi:hypothetical protein